MIDGALVRFQRDQVPVEGVEDLLAAPLGRGEAQLDRTEHDRGLLGLAAARGPGPEDARHQGRVRLALGGEAECVGVVAHLDERRKHFECLVGALERRVIDVAPHDREPAAGQVQQRADVCVRQCVHLSPVLDEQLVGELELPAALGRVADGEEQVDLTAPQALEALLPGALDVLELPLLLPGDVLEHVHVDALGTALLVAEDQRRVRVRTDAKRRGGVERRGRRKQDADEGDEGGQRAVNCCHVESSSMTSAA